MSSSSIFFAPGEMVRRAAANVSSVASSTVSTVASVASVATGGRRRSSNANRDLNDAENDMIQNAKEKIKVEIKVLTDSTIASNISPINDCVLIVFS
jgi:hypothetical protein